MYIAQLTFVILCICVSLISGLLFSFSIAVSPGLKHVSNIEFLKSMKSINKEIINILFLICFLGPIFLFPVLIYFNYDYPFKRVLAIIGYAFYIVVIGITALVNVPLNNQLERFDIFLESEGELADVRMRFENRWVFWNNIRTVFSIGSLTLVISSQFDLAE